VANNELLVSWIAIHEEQTHNIVGGGGGGCVFVWGTKKWKSWKGSLAKICQE